MGRSRAGRVRVAVALAVIAVLGATACKRSPQAKETAFLETGKKYFEKKDYARATLEFKNAIQVMPKDPEPYYQLGLVCLEAGDVKTAVMALRRVTELNPKHAGAQLRLAQLMSTSRDKDLLAEAQKRALDVLNVLPDDADALNVLASTELRLGKPEDAEQHLRQALLKSPKHLRSSIALAQARLAHRDVQGAEAVLQQAVAQNPKSADPVFYLGEFYLALSKTTEAEQQFRRALTLDPKYGPALLQLGAMQARAGQNDQAEQTFKQLSAIGENRYKPAYALFLFQSGKREAAVTEFEKLAKEDPSDREARTRLVKAYLAVNRAADAEKILTAALKKNSKDVDALLQRSRLYLAAGKYTETQQDLNQVLRVRPTSGEGHYMMSRLHLAKGAAENRKQELGEALKVEPGFLAARIELAQILLGSNAAKTAIQVLDEAPAQQKNSLPVVVQRNWALLGLGEKQEARKWIDQVLAKSKVPEVLLQDAALKLDQRDFAGARASAEAVLQQNPEELRALRALMSTYTMQKQTAAGIERLRGYAAQHAASPRVQQYLGQVLVADGKPAEARKAFEAAKAAAPKSTEADLSLAQLDLTEGKLDPARKTLSAILAADARNVGARLMLAGLEDKTGNVAGAIENYRKVLDVDPRNAAALNNLAYDMTEHANQPDEGLKYAQQAKEIAPESPAVDDTLGWIYFRKGIYMSAVKHLESAVAREGSARRRYHLAMAYVKAGQLQRAHQAFDAALKMDANVPEAEAARRMLLGAGR
jgi:tetratricopeptide (TPR) repeat protein